jgi:hypothetical protein
MENEVLTITLTGQSMIRGDTRADVPDAVPVIKSLIKGDAAFTNFEAAVYDPAKGQTTKAGRFASPPSSIEALKSFGFNLLSLANNHAFDLKVSGIVNTLETCERLDIGHAGTGRDLGAADSAYFLDTPKGTIGLVVVASGLVLDGAATSTRPGMNELRVAGETPNSDDVARILDRVREPISLLCRTTTTTFQASNVRPTSSSSCCRNYRLDWRRRSGLNHGPMSSSTPVRMLLQCTALPSCTGWRSIEANQSSTVWATSSFRYRRSQSG